MEREKKIEILRAAGLACHPGCDCIGELAGMLSDEAVKMISRIAGTRELLKPFQTGADRPTGNGGLDINDLFDGLIFMSMGPGLRRGSGPFGGSD